jgi:hypothetical protein
MNWKCSVLNTFNNSKDAKYHSELCTQGEFCSYTMLTYLWSWVLPEKLPVVELFRKFPAILRNPKVHHRVLKSPPLVPTIPFYLRSILILSTHLRLGLPSGLFPSGFPANILYAVVSAIRATCPAHRILLHPFQLTYLLTELSPSWEAANCVAIQEIPSNFKKPEGSSPCSQELSTGPYHPILSKIHFNTVHPPTSWSF